MANAKVILDGVTLMDVTNDTVTADSLLYGITATRNDGVQITGTIQNGSITTGDLSQQSSGTISRGQKIYISEGYYSSGVCYTAEANSGTKSITISDDSSSNISCDGYANVTITGINIPIPSTGTNTFSVKVPNGNSTVTFVFNVDTSGNVTITEG